MKKAGILGGGQLGRMLLQAAINYPVETYVLEKESDCPAAHLCHHFIQGDILDYDTVLAFGKGLDVLTIEIEAVNVAALKRLEEEGVKVIPSPSALSILKNKILQKDFYKSQQIPTAAYIPTENRAALEKHANFLPAVHKLAEGGYDGKGVQVIEGAEQLELGFDAPAVLEKKIPVATEISVLVAVDSNGISSVYPPAAMVFDPILNLLDYQVSPASISESLSNRAASIASEVAKKLASPGLFAIELLVDKEGSCWVNETAPRVHNSGHHTIEGNECSQFDMLWRILLDYPLGSTAPRCQTVLVNLLGAAGQTGAANYKGLNEILAIPEAYVHLYGKKQTKPGRKMGHITFCGNEVEELIAKAEYAKKMIQVVAAP